MSAERINLELMEIYGEWLTACVGKLKEQKPQSRKYKDKYGYSAPFVTGPNYRKATKYALGKEDYYEKHTVPSINGDVILQLTSYTVEGKSIPVIWTYHPNFMSRHDLEGHIRDIEAMIDRI